MADDDMEMVASDTKQSVVQRAGVSRDTNPIHIVYAICFLPIDLVVYIGSTERALNFERRDEHTRLRGGARRVTIAFAQSWFQPVLKFFEFRELWRGECTAEQARGIEQHFIDKHETKVTKRSRETCVARDTDLMQPDTVPRKLNINNACSDPSVVAWAAQRVERDSGLTVHLSPMEKQCTMHIFETMRIEIESAAELTAPLVVNRCIAKYTAMRPTLRLGATEVHTDFNRVYAALRDDDGLDARRCCRAKMKAFSFDHHPDETWSVACVLAELKVVEATLGLPPPQLVGEVDLESLSTSPESALKTRRHAVYSEAPLVRSEVQILVDKCLVALDGPEKMLPMADSLEVSEEYKALPAAVQALRTALSAAVGPIVGDGRAGKSAAIVLKDVKQPGDGKIVNNAVWFRTLFKLTFLAVSFAVIQCKSIDLGDLAELLLQAGCARGQGISILMPRALVAILLHEMTARMPPFAQLLAASRAEDRWAPAVLLWELQWYSQCWLQKDAVGTSESSWISLAELKYQAHLMPIKAAATQRVVCFLQHKSAAFLVRLGNGPVAASSSALIVAPGSTLGKRPAQGVASSSAPFASPVGAPSVLQAAAAAASPRTGDEAVGLTKRQKPSPVAAANSAGGTGEGGDSDGEPSAPPSAPPPAPPPATPPQPALREITLEELLSRPPDADPALTEYYDLLNEEVEKAKMWAHDTFRVIVTPQMDNSDARFDMYSTFVKLIFKLKDLPLEQRRIEVSKLMPFLTALDRRTFAACVFDE